MSNNFELLLTREIIDIFIGDASISKEEVKGKEIEIGLPYLKGRTICEISLNFGLEQEEIGLSRWQYFEKLLKFCIEHDKASELIFYLLNKDKFSKKLSGLSVKEIEKTYEKIIKEILNRINGELYFKGYELYYTDKYYIKKIGEEEIKVYTPILNEINYDYIKNLSGRALNDIEEGNYDSAITKSRTLIEEVFCYVIEKKKKNQMIVEIFQSYINKLKSCIICIQTKIKIKE